MKHLISQRSMFLLFARWCLQHRRAFLFALNIRAARIHLQQLFMFFDLFSYVPIAAPAAAWRRKRKKITFLPRLTAGEV